MEIFTDRDGEVIFKKYSPIGELGDFAGVYAETLSKTSGFPVCITDKDSVIAVYGASKKELAEKRISSDIESVMDEKAVFTKTRDSRRQLSIVDGIDKYRAGVVAPIISEGDTVGSVIIASNENDALGEVETKLAQSAATFLGRHIEG